MKNVKIGIIVAGAAAVVFLALFLSEDQDSFAGIDGHMTAWKCKACGQRFDLTEPDVQSAMEDSGGVPIYCDECTKVQVYRLSACLRCGTLFFGPDVPGGLSYCPKCPRKAKPGPEDPTYEPPKKEGGETFELPDRPKRVAPKSL